MKWSTFYVGCVTCRRPRLLPVLAGLVALGTLALLRYPGAIGRLAINVAAPIPMKDINSVRNESEISEISSGDTHLEPLTEVSSQVENNATDVQAEGLGEMIQPDLHVRPVPAGKQCNKGPDILIIGFEKCGTVTLKEYLDIHPQIFAPHEPNDRYFHPDTNMSADAYRRTWQCTPKGQLKVSKLALGGLPENVYRANKIMKLLVVVKDPVVRALSHFIHRVAKGEEKPDTFETVVSNLFDEGTPYKSVLFKQGMYSFKLKPWLVYFPKDQIHIVDGENFVKNPSEELQKLERFLELKPYITKNNFVFNKEKGFYCVRGATEDVCMNGRKGRPHPSVSPPITRRLRDYFKPLNEEFFREFRQRFEWGTD